MRPALCVASVLVVSILATGPDGALGQIITGKPVRIVTSAVGGGNDIIARLLAQEIGGALGGPVIVDNRGGSGNAYAEIVAKAAPDGQTLLLTGNSFWTGPLLRKAPFDPLTDFATVTMVATSPGLIVVHPSLPVNSVRDLIALAKARPGQLNYSSGELGSGTHLAGELFNYMAGVKIVRVPYKGAGPALNGVLTGETQLIFATAGSVMGTHVKSGRLRAIAVASPQRTVLAPGLPTAAESGLPEFQALQITGIWLPARTPVAVIGKLNGEIVRVLSRPDVKEKLLGLGGEVVGSTSREFAVYLEADTAKLRKLIRDVGIQAD